MIAIDVVVTLFDGGKVYLGDVPLDELDSRIAEVIATYHCSLNDLW